MLEASQIISLSALIITNAAALIAVFVKLNVKIAEIAKDYISIKSDFEEHKLKNKEDIMELKQIALRDRIDNKDDHQRIVDELNHVNKSISDLRVDIIKAIKNKDGK